MSRIRSVLLAVQFVAVLAAASLAALPARAADNDVEARINALAVDNYADIEKAVNALAQTADPRSVPVLKSLEDSALYQRTSDHKIFITKPGSGDTLSLTDPITGADAGTAPESSLTRVRVNNRIRSAIDSVMGALTLLSPDAAIRRSAADSILASPDATTLPALESAIAHESDASVKKRLEQARAAIILTSDQPEADKMAAVATLRVRGDEDALALITNAQAKTADGALKTAMTDAITSLQSRLQLWSIVQNLWYGLSLGSVLLLAAVGLAITFGVMGVINMAHGELVMIGAYTTFVVQQAMQTYTPSLANYSLIVAVPAAFLVAGAFGVAIERSIIRFLYGRPLETLLATWGLSLFLRQLIRSVFGPTNRDVVTPSWMSGGFEIVGGLSLTYNRIAIILFSLFVMGLLMVLLRRTIFGLQMRAVTQNRPMASAMGIRTGQVDALTFGLGSGIAGVAGVALSQIDNVSPNLGQNYIVDSFMVVVFGGVGNLWGTLVAAMSLGVVNKFLEPYTGAVLGKIFVLVALILFIQKRPRGLFPIKGRAVEA